MNPMRSRSNNDKASFKISFSNCLKLFEFVMGCTTKRIHHYNVQPLAHGVSVSLYDFALWGRDLVSLVRIRDVPYYRGIFLRKCGEFSLDLGKCP